MVSIGKIYKIKNAESAKHFGRPLQRFIEIEEQRGGSSSVIYTATVKPFPYPDGGFTFRLSKNGEKIHVLTSMKSLPSGGLAHLSQVSNEYSIDNIFL